MANVAAKAKTCAVVSMLYAIICLVVFLGVFFGVFRPAQQDVASYELSRCTFLDLVYIDSYPCEGRSGICVEFSALVRFTSVLDTKSPIQTKMSLREIPLSQMSSSFTKYKNGTTHYCYARSQQGSVRVVMDQPELNKGFYAGFIVPAILCFACCLAFLTVCPIWWKARKMRLAERNTTTTNNTFTNSSAPTTIKRRSSSSSLSPEDIEMAYLKQNAASDHNYNNQPYNTKYTFQPPSAPPYTPPSAPPLHIQPHSQPQDGMTSASSTITAPELGKVNAMLEISNIPSYDTTATSPSSYNQNNNNNNYNDHMVVTSTTMEVNNYTPVVSGSKTTDVMYQPAIVDSVRMCQMCLGQPSDTKLIPCGHSSFCHTCVATLMETRKYVWS
eukprot:TRINITY_DN17002_c0_g1_i3.p1 TRINITY_DN17002_c0_g1~~TRINITY_DN17002_c0_g1_i3.p1  ORF type:complete len:386 (-),score=82.40 TRINITY_DN17002_c0_g1_i3:99-1256(-)